MTPENMFSVPAGASSKKTKILIDDILRDTIDLDLEDDLPPTSAPALAVPLFTSAPKSDPSSGSKQPEVEEMKNELGIEPSISGQFGGDRVTKRLDTLISHPSNFSKAFKVVNNEEVKLAIFNGCFNPNDHSALDNAQYHGYSVSFPLPFTFSSLHMCIFNFLSLFFPQMLMYLSEALTALRDYDATYAKNIKLKDDNVVL